MTRCTNQCRICDSLVISDSVAVAGTTLVINIPEGSYGNGEIYCIIAAQAIPDAATINMPVAISIGGDTATLYPLTDRCGVQLTASELRTRTRYKAMVRTNATGGIFRLFCKFGNRTTNDLAALPAPAPAAGA